MSETERRQIVWHDAEIVKRAGNSPAGVRALLDKYNLPLPSDWAVYQWVSRKNIPDRWRAALIYVLMSEKLISTDRLFCRASVKIESSDG